MLLSWAIFLPVMGQLAAAQGQPPASLSYIRQHCPKQCRTTGSKQANWDLYQGINQLAACPQTLFYSFSLFDPVDKLDIKHRIYSCTNYGSDWHDVANTTPPMTQAMANNITFDIMLSSSEKVSQGVISGPDARSVLRQMSQYFAGADIENQHLGTSIYASVNNTSVGIYVGSGFDSRSLSEAINVMGNYIMASNTSSTTAIMQSCKEKDFASHSFGIVVNGDGSFNSIQEGFKLLNDGKCMPMKSDSSYTLPVAYYSQPAYPSNNGTTTQNSTVSVPSSNATLSKGSHRYRKLETRDECRTQRVPEHSGCPEMAGLCGISPHDFDQYNSSPGFCQHLRPGQLVCCSPGTLPDIRPKPYNNGTCAFTSVHQHDNCDTLAASNGLTLDELMEFNEHTWGWTKCNPLYAEAVICLSSGHPPPPPIVANAVCGPQAPNGHDHSSPNYVDWNPCPLKACCDIWGQCGTTEDFCVDTNTGPPGTARDGTNGCISNCGTDIKQSAIGSSNFRTIGYFEGFNLNRKCLFQDASQINTNHYTHIHFAFGLITPDFKVDMGDALTKFQFQQFIRITAGPKRIISFGGWDFSTGPNTYHIFRDGVTDANRNTLARNIAQFVLDNNLDGVDIDWEYPGAQDIPNIPPSSLDDGKNFVAFLRRLRGYLPDKSISIAAASSFWYLRGFPIQEISDIVDYIIYMTYDLHGQWDADNKWSQTNCPSGRCLRSGVNLTETLSSLSMITKAGVPSDKVVVGITSYGRSHGMADGNCHTPECFFTGGPLDSTATKGLCTDTKGYISNAEIYDILKTPSRVKLSYMDEDSNTNILVYDDNQWVGYMDEATRNHRTSIYKHFGMGGTSNWAIDLEGYNDVPQQFNTGGSDSPPTWASIKSTIIGGHIPNAIRGERNGNWSHLKCTDPAVVGKGSYSSAMRWQMLDASDAWLDGIAEFKTQDRPRQRSLSLSLADTYHDIEGFKCHEMDNAACAVPTDCMKFEAEGSGPAAYLIHNSFVAAHMVYQHMSHTLTSAMAQRINPALDSFMDDFAPIPTDDETDKWVNFILDMISMVATAGFGSVFNSYLSKFPAFKDDRGANFKDAGMSLIGGIINAAKDFKKSSGQDFHWTVEDQHKFKAFMGTISSAWDKIVEAGLHSLFNGTDESIDRLGRLIQNGQMIDDQYEGGTYVEDKYDQGEAVDNFVKVMFGYSIPAVWRVSHHQAFVLDAGVRCNDPQPESTYIHPDTAAKTKVCFEDRQYYLVMPPNEPNEKCIPCRKGDCLPEVCHPNQFIAPVGIDKLDGKNQTYGFVSKDQIVIGSIRTFRANNGNGGGPSDFTNTDVASALSGLDLTTPGFARLPVCSGETAHKIWGTEGPSGSKWPCPDNS